MGAAFRAGFRLWDAGFRELVNNIHNYDSDKHGTNNKQYLQYSYHNTAALTRVGLFGLWSDDVVAESDWVSAWNKHRALPQPTLAH